MRLLVLLRRHDRASLTRPRAPAAPSPSVPLTPDAFGTPTPGSRLLAFLLSSLTPRASTYALPLTVLLKGARGSGKRVLLRCVTRAAGVGLLELDCFDLLGESDAKTEGRLRALAVDKALACAPVVLVLRNIEALARKSQAMETGQGASCSSSSSFLRPAREKHELTRLRRTRTQSRQ